MKNTPTLEEVKAYFKDAKIVKSLNKNTLEDINQDCFEKSFFGYSYRDEKGWLHLVFENGEYAEIVERIEPAYTITKEIIEKYAMKEEFQEVFKKELIVGSWYKRVDDSVDWLMNYQENGKKCYGFNTARKYGNIYSIHSPEKWTEATEKEVSDALIAEAKKRGYKYMDYIKSLESEKEVHVILTKEKFYLFDINTLNLGNQVIFKNGIWATIVPVKQMSQSDIEKELGYKIEIV